MLVLVVGLQIKVSGNMWSGTAWVLNSDGYLVTADHVIGDGKIWQVRYKGQWYYAQVVARDKSNDIAILRAPIKNAIPLPVYADRVPSAYAALLGYPDPQRLGSNLKIAQGTVNWGGVFDTDAYFHGTTCHGNSGGPIIEGNGNAVAVLTTGNMLYSINDQCASEGAGPQSYLVIQLANKYGVSYEQAQTQNAHPFNYWFSKYQDSVLFIYGAD